MAKNRNGPVEDLEEGQSEDTNDDLNQGMTLDEYKIQRDAKKKAFSMKLSKLNVRQAGEGEDAQRYKTYEWIYRKTNNENKKWQHITDYTEEENTKKLVSILSTIEKHESNTDDNNQDEMSNDDENLQQEPTGMTSIQQEQPSISVQTTTESKQTLPQHPYLQTQFSDDYNAQINIYF
ncbi:hypothetical protein I4U23_003559 [Adineta vaga]|nr:hypothetical protein I4U23_003559 [Adineta vaga]